MEDFFEIRLIKDSDAEDVLEIYSPYVLNTYITFDYEVPSLNDFLQKIKTITSEYPWLVCLKNDKTIGYAYGSRHRYKTAYQWSPESTIYLSADFQGRGVGRILYETLFEIFRLQGYFNVYAGIGIPNEKSEGLHRAVGFEEIGVFKQVGYKLGKWHDTRWFHLPLGQHIDNPLVPVTIDEIKKSGKFESIIRSANERLYTRNKDNLGAG